MNNRPTGEEWLAVCHLCEMEALEGVRGPKTIAAEAAFWAIRNRSRTPQNSAPTKPPSAPIKAAAPIRPPVSPVKKPDFSVRKKNRRLAALLPHARPTILPANYYAGMEDWVDEKAVYDESFYDKED